MIRQIPAMLVLLSVFCVAPALAQEGNIPPEVMNDLAQEHNIEAKPSPAPPLDETASLEVQAIQLAAIGDAFNMNCNKETQITAAYLKKFIQNGMAAEQIKQLEEIGVYYFETTVKNVVEGKRECVEVALLLERFQIMRKLRNVSYRLEGVDPASVPSEVDFSGIEALIPSGEPLTPPKTP